MAREVLFRVRNSRKVVSGYLPHRLHRRGCVNGISWVDTIDRDSSKIRSCWVKSLIPRRFIYRARVSVGRCRVHIANWLGCTAIVSIIRLPILDLEQIVNQTNQVYFNYNKRRLDGLARRKEDDNCHSKCGELTPWYHTFKVTQIFLMASYLWRCTHFWRIQIKMI